MPKNLINIPVTAPGSNGLNTQNTNVLLSPLWATIAENCIIDDTGRLGSRLGYKHTNATAIPSSPTIRQVHEYIDANGNTIVIAAAGNAIYKVDGSALTDISGTITTPTADNWKFVNFNSKCIGFQAGHPPIVLDTVLGSFADITVASGTATANEVLSAFGRLWILDGNSLKYSALLDETNWATAAGEFDLSTVWPTGADTGVALAEFNGYLIVFGKKSIIVYKNPWVPTGTGQTDVGNEMSLVESIAGIGCVARDTVCSIGEDIVFLSNKGVRSLGRTIQEKSMPMSDLSINVSDTLTSLVAPVDKDNIKAIYSRQEGYYLLSLPDDSVVYCFDTKKKNEDNTMKVTTWDMTLTGLCDTLDGDIYFGLDGYTAIYQGNKDAVLSDGTGGTTFEATYRSGWTDLHPDISDKIKILKSIYLRLYGGASQTVRAFWDIDFGEKGTSTIKTLIDATPPYEWNIAEYGYDGVSGVVALSEYSGGVTHYKLNIPLKYSGRVVRFKIILPVNNEQIALQQLNIKAKVGRMD